MSTMWHKKENWHPAANVFPLIEGKELKDLSESIKKDGQQNPIVVHEGKVLDGRNRARACALAGVPVRVVRWESKLDPMTWVIAQNLIRRQMTKQQLAACAVDAEKVYAVQAGLRRQAGLKKGPEIPVTPFPAEREGEAATQAGKAFGVGKTLVKDVKRLEKIEPGVKEKIKAGTETVQAALRRHKLVQELEPDPGISESYKQTLRDMKDWGKEVPTRLEEGAAGTWLKELVAILKQIPVLIQENRISPEIARFAVAKITTAILPLVKKGEQT